MKKIESFVSIVLALAVAFTASSCVAEEYEPSEGIKELKFNVSVINASSPDTKTVKTAWTDNDKVYLFFNVTTPASGHLTADKYVTLTYDEGTSTWSGALSGNLTDATEIGTAGTMYGIYFPFGTVTIASDGANGVTFLDGEGNPVYAYYMTGDASYTVESSGDVGTLTASLSLAIPDNYVWFFIEKSGSEYCTDDTYRLSVDGVAPAACNGFSAGVFSTTAKGAGYPMKGYNYSDLGVAFTGKIDATWASSASHIFALYTAGTPAPLTKAVTTSLPSHASVKLANPSDDINGWTKRGFRGFEISPGILKRNNDSSFGLTDGSNPFELYDYYDHDVSKDVYYFDWNVLKTDLGEDGSGNILTNSTNLPDGWNMPTDNNYQDIIYTKPVVRILLENSDGTITKLNTNGNVSAQVSVTKGSNTYKGVVIFRDGTFIPKEAGITQYGYSNYTYNDITYAQFQLLKEAGCEFFCVSGHYDSVFSEWESGWPNGDSGYYWSATKISSNAYYLKTMHLTVGQTTYNDFMPVRLIKTL